MEAEADELMKLGFVQTESFDTFNSQVCILTNSIDYKMTLNTKNYIQQSPPISVLVDFRLC